MFDDIRPKAIRHDLSNAAYRERRRPNNSVMVNTRAPRSVFGREVLTMIGSPKAPDQAMATSAMSGEPDHQKPRARAPSACIAGQSGSLPPRSLGSGTLGGGDQSCLNDATPSPCTSSAEIGAKEQGLTILENTTEGRHRQHQGKPACDAIEEQRGSCVW